MEKEIGWLLKEKYFGKPNKKFYKDLERLKAGEPLAYVIGFAEFLGCKIDLSKKPLIPRPETEFWVGEVLKDKPFDSAQGKILHILDVFSGSGCIGIAISRHVKNTKIDFVDFDKKAVEQIKINLKINPSSSKTTARRSKVIRSNVFDKVVGKYDYIFANPPYIPTTRKGKVGKSVLKFEPKVALFGGADGLFYIRKFLRDAKKHLSDAGKIFIEFDSPQKKEIEKLIKKYNYNNFEFYRDQYGRWRWVTVYF